MNPAPSVIIFTTLSGLGFGLLIWLGLGILVPTGWVAFVFFTIAYLLAVGGLTASVFHLGHPERALKAFTQWRSSWLSREAWLSVGALTVMAIYGAGLVFWGAVWAPLGWLGAALCFGTVIATTMIYTQMRTIPRWQTWLTPALFVALSLAGGAVLTGQAVLAAILLVAAGAIQIAWWLRGDGALARSGTDLVTATGLGHIGTPRSFEPPHTGTNYLTREFIHVVGRRHALKLRIIALILGYVLPVALLGLPLPHVAAVLATLCHATGIFASRWLFFAEAEHVVGLYYGKRVT